MESIVESIVERDLLSSFEIITMHTSHCNWQTLRCINEWYPGGLQISLHIDLPDF